MNLFEEIEFFKNLDEGLYLPILLTLMFTPNLMINLLPFIVFFSSIWYFVELRNNKDLLSLKTYGFSNLKIIIILSTSAFMFGVFTILAINPVSSSMIKYYETTKAKYSKDIEHLVSINRNGVWIKEKINNNLRIISAKKLSGNYLHNITIYELDENNRIIERIESKQANIENNEWFFESVNVLKKGTEFNSYKNLENYKLISNYNARKLSNLYKNLDTVSFINLITNYNSWIQKGYSKKIVDEQINKIISLPIFLLLMVVLAAIFTLGSNKRSQNIYYIFVSITTCLVIYYFKDFTLALAQTNRISLEFAIWMPLLAISLFCSIGVLQINEK